jgi:hypothetical protein
VNDRISASVRAPLSGRGRAASDQRAEG